MVPLWLFLGVCGSLVGYAALAGFRGAWRLCRVADTLGVVPRMRMRLPWPRRVLRWCVRLLPFAAFATAIALQLATENVVRVRDRDGALHAERWRRFGNSGIGTVVVNESSRPLPIYRIYYAAEIVALVPPGGVGAAPEIDFARPDMPLDVDSIDRTWLIRVE